MRKNKMIAKACPKCNQQVPVACKNCPCGHSFFLCKKARGVSPSYDLLKLFVVQQRKREKPKFYDSLIYEKQLKKNKATTSSEPQPQPSSSSNEEELDDNKRERKRAKIRKREDNYDEMVSKLTEDKAVQCKIILDELNRKTELVSWKPYL